METRPDSKNVHSEAPNSSQSNYKTQIFDDYDADTDAVDKPLLADNASSNETEQSPYEEIAVNISNTDDTNTLCLTLRSMFIGVLLTCMTAFINQFFALRTSPLDINLGIVILISYMIGELMSKILPERLFSITINPGPFTMKEHALITIMATSGIRTYEGIESLTIQRLHFKFYLSHFNSVLLLIVMHFSAISIAGLLKRYLIWPGFMIWPKTLMSCSLIRTLVHEDQFSNDNSRWKITRSHFFWLIVLFHFLWYWLPGYIFPLLSFFSVICFIAPKNVIWSQITGANGLGFGAFEFDWNACVAYLDSPIVVPFWAHVHMFAGFVFVLWIVVPLLYYLNVWESKKFPIISNRAFDQYGYYYNTSKVMRSDYHVNETALQIYGPPYITTGFLVSYTFGITAISALLVHTILYYGKSIVQQFNASLSNKTNDIHAKLMSYYSDVPEWWYYIILMVSFLIGLILCDSTGMLPTALMPLAFFITVVFSLPNGIIAAITSLGLAMSAPSDLLSSQFLLGNPIGYLTFRTLTFTCQDQTLIYLMNAKIGHYMKIPPRVVFLVFILASIIVSIIQYVTVIYLLTHVPDICTPANPIWRCSSLETTFTTSILFSVVGSFNSSSQYSPVLYGFLIGAILPIFSWLLCRRYRHIKWLTLINFPIFLTATNALMPAPAVEFPTWFLVGFIFNFILYRYAHDWWEKYAYIFSIAMSCGVAICGVVIFFTLQLNHVSFPEWWGLGGPTGDGCPLDIANYSGFVAKNKFL